MKEKIERGIFKRFLLLLVMFLLFASSLPIWANESNTKGPVERFADKIISVEENTFEQAKTDKSLDSDKRSRSEKEFTELELKEKPLESGLDEKESESILYDKDRVDSILNEREKEDKSNEKQKIKIRKKITNSDEYLPGARLALYRIESNGEAKEVLQWMTEDDEKDFELESGQYRIVELEAPDGYKKSLPLEFTVRGEPKDDEHRIDIDTEYLGYINGMMASGEMDYPIFVRKMGDEGIGQVAYCYNRSKDFPKSLFADEVGPSFDRSTYKKELGTGRSFEDKADRNNLTGEELKDRIISVVLNGFPYNKSGIQEKYDLSNAEFQYITQRAVWAFTDNGTATGLNQIEKEAYQELIDSSYQLLNEHSTLYLYTPNNLRFQNLLSVEIDEPCSITMYNEREVFKERSSASLNTIVSANNRYATERCSLTVYINDEKQPVDIKDSIHCQGLDKNETYLVQGKIYELLEDETGPYVGETPISISAIYPLESSAEGEGIWPEKVSFDNLKLEEGKKYVVFEYAVKEAQHRGKNVFDNSNDVLVKHDDATATSQTFYVKREPKIMTKVSINGIQSKEDALEWTKETENELITIKDSVQYKNLAKDCDYFVQGRLYNIEERRFVKDSPVVSLKTSESGEGIWENKIIFENVDLKSGQSYVVYEYIIGHKCYDEGNIYEKRYKNKVIKHEDPNDKDQTVIIRSKPVLRTYVNIGQDQANIAEPLTIEVSDDEAISVEDSLIYKNFEKNKKYKIQGKLYDVNNKKVIKVSEIAERVTSDAGSGEWEKAILFKDVSLNGNNKYVVFEYAVKSEEYQGGNVFDSKYFERVIFHEDVEDKAQTIVTKSKKGNDNPKIDVPDTSSQKTKNRVGKNTPKSTPYFETQVSYMDKNANALEPLKVEKMENYVLKDTIKYMNFIKDEEYLLQGKLYKTIENAGKYEISGVPVAISDIIKLKATSSHGTWEKAITFKDVNLEAGGRYVVYEYAILDSEAKNNQEVFSQDSDKLIRHENPNDRAQTIVVIDKDKPLQPVEGKIEEKPEKNKTPEETMVKEQPKELLQINEPKENIEITTLQKDENISPKTHVKSIASSVIVMILSMGAFLFLERRRRA